MAFYGFQLTDTVSTDANLSDKSFLLHLHQFGKSLLIAPENIMKQHHIDLMPIQFPGGLQHRPPYTFAIKIQKTFPSRILGTTDFGTDNTRRRDKRADFPLISVFPCRIKQRISGIQCRSQCGLQHRAVHGKHPQSDIT